MNASPVPPPLWRMLTPLVVVATLLAATAAVVDLTPRVDSEFFFAPGDPALRAEQKISERFGALGQVVVLATGDDVENSAYRERIEQLTRAVQTVDGVLAVHSLARGPDGLADARDSPLWRRLVLGGDGRTSFVIAELRESRARQAVEALEDVVEAEQSADFQLALAGVPYTVEVMRRQLVRDFSVFSAAAVVVFGTVILLVFRSGWILLGTLVTCVGSVAGTLLALQGFGFGIGLLTANLTTIVFVLAQSHVVFMTTNWEAVDRSDPRQRAARARRRTLRASLGSAATTVLGFGSLLFVPAEPLQELGAGGSLGALIALGSAYLFMPAFLERRRPRIARAGGRDAPRWTRPGRAGALAVAAFCLLLTPGLMWLDTDPSLLAYFEEESDVREALGELDRSGGSSPLTLVVQRRDRARLDSETSYERLWELQRALEGDPSVGRVVSLPLLIAEARRVPGSFLLTEDWILDLIGPETTGAFLTADRRQTLFLLQMSESSRDVRRSRVIERLRGIVADHGFDAPLAGGVYALQSRLSDLVARSVVWSLGALLVLFVVVAGVAAGSPRVGIAAGVATGLVPLGVLGSFGALGVPLDVIAAPAASVGLGLAADAALHAIAAWRRLAARSEDRAAAWTAACREQWRGIVRCTGIVALGFGLFAFSIFPPTQRFGLGVAWAAVLGALVSLQVLPAAARGLGPGRGRAPKREKSR